MRVTLVVKGRNYLKRTIVFGCEAEQPPLLGAGWHAQENPTKSAVSSDERHVERTLLKNLTAVNCGAPGCGAPGSPG